MLLLPGQEATLTVHMVHPAHSSADTQCHWLELVPLSARETELCISKAVSLPLFADMAGQNTEVLAEARLLSPQLISGHYPRPSPVQEPAAVGESLNSIGCCCDKRCHYQLLVAGPGGRCLKRLTKRQKGLPSSLKEEESG